MVAVIFFGCKAIYLVKQYFIPLVGLCLMFLLQYLQKSCLLVSSSFLNVVQDRGVAELFLKKALTLQLKLLTA
jgi:hypothetical protein